MLPECREHPGKFTIFLHCRRRDAVLDITEEENDIGPRLPDTAESLLLPLAASALEIYAVPCQVGFNTEVQVGDDQDTQFVADKESRAAPDEFEVHSSFTMPAAGW